MDGAVTGRVIHPLIWFVMIATLLVTHLLSLSPEPIIITTDEPASKDSIYGYRAASHTGFPGRSCSSFKLRV